MGKPRLIILIRHAQSEGNKNREIHQTIPDHRVKLTTLGWDQAHAAGKKLRSLLRPDDTLHFFTSPYRRTRETTEGILETLTSNEPAPSPYPRHTIKVYEEPRLREQDFGNFQPDSAAMTKMWHERAAYGHFFYRIPNGESAADAYDRVSGFNESLWRSFGNPDFPSVCVLVTHGLMARVFLMKWYHFSVDYFEDLRNIDHCEFLVMARSDESGKYVLRNHLRTWSEYKAEKEGASLKSPVPVRKRWGGCIDGGETDKQQKREPRRQNTADLFKDDGSESLSHLTAAMKKRDGKPRHFEEVEQDDGDDKAIGKLTGTTMGQHTLSEREIAEMSQSRTVPEILGEVSNEATNKLLNPTKPLNRLVYLRSGRDGGGSRSGNVSPNDSDDEEDDTEREDNTAKQVTKKSTLQVSTQRPQAHHSPRSLAMALNGTLNEDGVSNSGAMADALGDQSDLDEDDADEVERVDRSFAGSVR